MKYKIKIKKIKKMKVINNFPQKIRYTAPEKKSKCTNRAPLQKSHFKNKKQKLIFI